VTINGCEALSRSMDCEKRYVIVLHAATDGLSNLRSLVDYLPSF
jgi:hypothetical protein